VNIFIPLEDLPPKRLNRALKLLRTLRSPACRDIRFAADGWLYFSPSQNTDTTVAAEDLEDCGFLAIEYRVTPNGAEARLRLRELATA
jgi:hypothetical protein